MALFGWLLTARFDAALTHTLPPALRAQLTPEQLAQLRNPLALLQPEGAASAGLTATPGLTAGAAEAVRLALAQALHETFLVGAILMAVALVVVCFLREIPLRQSNLPPAAEHSVELVPAYERSAAPLRSRD